MDMLQVWLVNSKQHSITFLRLLNQEKYIKVISCIIKMMEMLEKKVVSITLLQTQLHILLQKIQNMVKRYLKLKWEWLYILPIQVINWMI
ncbi:MAG: hypothetical protein CMG80_17270 [Marinobacter sp.]|nr:hypothetical protein [Marinobacter sp.]